jgi:thiol-disulfide isomerase/thioredoxin
MRRILLFFVIFAAALTIPRLLARDAKAPGADTPAKRTPEQIEAALQANGDKLGKANEELQALVKQPEDVTDPMRRKELAPKVIPLVKQIAALLDEMIALRPDAKDEVTGAKLDLLGTLSLYGDADAQAALDKLAKSTAPEAVDAKAAQLLAAFWNDPKDQGAQLKILDEMETIAKANPKDLGLVDAIMKMSKMGVASKAVTEKAENIVLNTLTSDRAKQAGAQITVLRSIGKPIELTGAKFDGAAFSTRDWKGKVILVDFWATWCPPCVKGLPMVKKAYIDFHAKGLEILGVSSDNDQEQLKAFLEQNKDMPWPQLFQPKLPDGDLHPVAMKWGVYRLPTMFLIDRQGVLRSIDAHENFAEEIPKLLAEKAE